MRRSAKFAAMMLLPIVLSACAASDDGKSITYTDDRGVSSQPFPKNYRTEVLAFFKTYLNNPVGVRDAVMAEPIERAILFVDGRLDRIIENAVEPCAGVAYAPFVELEKMTR